MSKPPALSHDADAPSVGPSPDRPRVPAPSVAPSTGSASGTGLRALRHRPHEDLQALVVGTLFVALGVVLFKEAGLLTGGTAGVAFLVHYATGWNFSLVFAVLNLPFYALAWWRMGGAFTGKTILAVTLMAGFAEGVPHWLTITQLSVPFAAVMGGLLVGTGMLILFRHRASLGGFNILALYLQDTRGWRAGHLQLALDLSIVAIAFSGVPWTQIAWSVVGAIAMNLTLAINHRPGRYLAV